MEKINIENNISTDMYFVRKKELKVTGTVLAHIVQCQLENYCVDRKIIIKHHQEINKLEK